MKPVPWAALRRDWMNRDWAKQFYELQQLLLPRESADTPRGWVWPWMVVQNDKLQIPQPPRRGTYGNCLSIMSWVHRKLGIDAHFTLHSPRFYIPGLAAQTNMPLELRRMLGHWGPNSSMPISYDQSGCVSELRAKQHLFTLLERGFQPSKDFEVPDIDTCQEFVRNMDATKRSVGPIQQKDIDGKPLGPLTSENGYLYNKTSHMLHRAHPEDRWRTVCPHVRKLTTVVYTHIPENDMIPMNSVRCATCWARTEADEDTPAWDLSDIDEGLRSELSSSSGSSEDLDSD